MANITRQTRKGQYDQALNSNLGGWTTIDAVRPADNDGRGWNPDAVQAGPNIAGEAISAGVPIYRKDSDDKWYICQASAAGNTEADDIHGWNGTNCPIGELLDVIKVPVQWGYAAGTAPIGELVYLSVTKGQLATLPAFPGQKAAGYSTNGSLIISYPQVFQSDNLLRQQAAIADLAGGAVVGAVVTAFNTLLAELRLAGILAT